MPNDTIDQDTTRTLARVANLLWYAAQQVFADAADEGPRSPRQLLGLGVHAAWCDTVQLLPGDATVDPAPPGETDPVPLLQAARELARTLPEQPGRHATSALAAVISDLLREATR
jgi:hypothetical protein